MAITITPSGKALGAEITGIDLSRDLAPAEIADIHAAWLEHLVLNFPGQDISPEDQSRFAAHFGTVGKYHRPKDQQHPDHASSTYMLISNIRENGQPIGAHPDGEMMFHTDTAYHENPHKATTLYGVEVPSQGGNTIFSNMYMVHDALPEALRQRLAGAMAMNVYEFGTTVKTFDRYDRDRVPHHTHPVLRRHPETGRIAAYVAPLMTEEIIGFPDDESRAILAEIYQLQTRPEFQYAHVWRTNDLVMWDNRCTVHARTDFSRDERRMLRRVTIEGAEAVMAA
ncbi:MAG: TauD/TfdA dioxygenase family protein [Alphaproteobacteria bacterium]